MPKHALGTNCPGKRFVSFADNANIYQIAKALSTPDRRVRQNKAGEWIGYIGRERVGNFKDDEASAKRWASYR